MLKSRLVFAVSVIASLAAALLLPTASGQQGGGGKRGADKGPPPPMPAILKNYQAVTAERLLKPEDGNWLMIRRTYDGWGYSPLDQIDKDVGLPARVVLDFRFHMVPSLRPGRASLERSQGGVKARSGPVGWAKSPARCRNTARSQRRFCPRG